MSSDKSSNKSKKKSSEHNSESKSIYERINIKTEKKAEKTAVKQERRALRILNKLPEEIVKLCLEFVDEKQKKQNHLTKITSLFKNTLEI